MKKITAATVKSFIRKNRSELLINVKSDFDGMTDCVQNVDGDFKLATEKKPGIVFNKNEPDLGINGVWFVGQSNDFFNLFKENGLIGYEVFNSCGSWIVAINNCGCKKLGCQS